MSKRLTLSQPGRTVKRALAMAALVLGVLAAPQTSLAASIHPHAPAITHVVHPDGSGDSPIVP